VKVIQALLVVALGSSIANADVNDCQNLFVGQILVQDGVSFRATFLNSPSDVSGSQWIYFNHWNSDDKKAALALLTAAKMAQHRVALVTNGPNGCAITTEQRLATSLYLSANP
jgi:hypothetical protein